MSEEANLGVERAGNHAVSARCKRLTKVEVNKSETQAHLPKKSPSEGAEPPNDAACEHIKRQRDQTLT